MLKNKAKKRSVTSLPDHPLVSIIIPVYRVEKYIEDCLTSVCQQTYDNIEVILVDDCSPDNSMAIAESVIAQENIHNHTFYIIHHETNRGSAAARISGINTVTGDLLMFLDSDDFFTTDNAVQEVVEKILLEKADLLIFDYQESIERGSQKIITPRIEQKEGTMKGEKYLSHIFSLESSNWMFCTKCFRKDLFFDYSDRLIAGYDMMEDGAVVIPYIFNAERITFLPKVLYNYRKDNTNSITTLYDADENLQKLKAIRYNINQTIDFLEKNKGKKKFVAFLRDYLDRFEKYCFISTRGRKGKIIVWETISLSNSQSTFLGQSKVFYTLAFRLYRRKFYTLGYSVLKLRDFGASVKRWFE